MLHQGSRRALRRHLCRSAALLLALLIAGSMKAASAPTASAPDSLIVRLQSRLDRLQSLKGRFVQSLDSRSLGRPRIEEGIFMIKKPAMMRWEYRKPEEKLAISDGKRTWLYVPADHDVQLGSVSDLEEGGAATLLLAGRMRLQRDFEVRRLSGSDLTAAGPQGVAGAVVFELTPVRRSADFEKLILAIDPERLHIRRITVLDALGDRMIFDLFDLVEDPPLADDLFHFDIPAGVEVMGNH